MNRPVLLPGRIRQRRLASGLRRIHLDDVLVASTQSVSCWERDPRLIPPMVELALAALEWRAMANRAPPQAGEGHITLTHRIDVSSEDVLEFGNTVTPLDDAIAKHVQSFNEELAGSEWTVSVTLPSSGQVCLRLEQRLDGDWEPPPHTLEICRRTLDEAVRSARKHIVPRRA
jgi:hypothetical protein